MKQRKKQIARKQYPVPLPGAVIPRTCMQYMKFIDMCTFGTKNTLHWLTRPLDFRAFILITVTSLGGPGAGVSDALAVNDFCCELNTIGIYGRIRCVWNGKPPQVCSNWSVCRPVEVAADLFQHHIIRSGAERRMYRLIEHHCSRFARVVATGISPATWNVHTVTLKCEDRTNYQCESWNRGYSSIVADSYTSLFLPLNQQQYRTQRRPQPQPKRVN